MKNDVTNNRLSPISRIFKDMKDKKLLFIKNHIKLDDKFENGFKCYNVYVDHYLLRKLEVKEKRIMIAYLELIGEFTQHLNLRIYIIYHRLMLPKYRTCSHSLRIHTGRKNNEDRTERICMCENNIQTIDHILFHCDLTMDIRTLINIKDYGIKTFVENANYSHASSLLRYIEDILYIKLSVQHIYMDELNFDGEHCIR